MATGRRGGCVLSGRESRNGRGAAAGKTKEGTHGSAALLPGWLLSLTGPWIDCSCTPCALFVSTIPHIPTQADQSSHPSGHPAIHPITAVGIYLILGPALCAAGWPVMYGMDVSRLESQDVKGTGRASIPEPMGVGEEAARRTCSASSQ